MYTGLVPWFKKESLGIRVSGLEKGWGFGECLPLLVQDRALVTRVRVWGP